MASASLAACKDTFVFHRKRTSQSQDIVVRVAKLQRRLAPCNVRYLTEKWVLRNGMGTSGWMHVKRRGYTLRGE